MPELLDLRDEYGGDLIIAGSAPSLDLIPDSFLRSRPLIVCNYFIMYRPTVVPLAWIGIDLNVLQDEDLRWMYLKPTMEFFFAMWKTIVSERHRTYWWANREDDHDGFAFNPEWGVHYPTVAHAAIWIGHILGFERFLLVGVDCTCSGTADITIRPGGKSNVPHFYDKKPGRHAFAWDLAWNNMARFAHKHGKSIVNLSPETSCTQLPRGDWHDYV